MANDIFDDVILALSQLEKSGEEEIYLSSKSRRMLFVETGCSAAVKTDSCDEGEGDNTMPASQKETLGIGKIKPLEKTDSGYVSHLSWDDLKQAVAQCSLCSLHKTRTNTVFGEGDPKAPVMFIGEGPGYYEDQSGKPFVGRAGRLLTKMIKAMQLSREEVFIANIVKCRPPKNRNPESAEAEQCVAYLNRQIDLVKPEALVLLGAVPLLRLLGKKGITSIHGTWFDYRKVPAIATYHPSFLLRSPGRKFEAWQDLQKVMLRVGKDPGRAKPNS